MLFVVRCPLLVLRCLLFVVHCLLFLVFYCTCIASVLYSCCNYLVLRVYFSLSSNSTNGVFYDLSVLFRIAFVVN